MMEDKDTKADETKQSKRRRSTKAKTVNGERVTPVTGLPASDRVESPPCPLCQSPRTFVYATRKPKRYYKCKRCGFTDYFTRDDVAAPVNDIQTR